MQSDPYGWHITLAFFGEVEGDDTNRLLAMYHTSLPTRWENSNIGHFALPIFLLLFATILASGAVSSALRREKGMPKLNAAWIPGELVIARFTFQSGDKRVTLKSCETEPPWQIKGGFKSKRIPPNSEYIFSLRFKEMHETDCQISLGLEVEELGSWTQYLRLSTQHLLHLPLTSVLQTKIQMVVLCLGKFLFWLFWPFFVKNTSLVVTYGFGLFLAIFFQTVDVFFDNFCYLS